jgi:uncharacterized protein YjbI with pentapeptide repeats
LAILVGANLTACHLVGAELIGTDLEDSILCLANLTKANFAEANLTNTNLTEANLKGAENLTIDQLSKVKTLYKTKLDEALLIPLKEKCPALFEVPDLR